MKKIILSLAMVCLMAFGVSDAFAQKGQPAAQQQQQETIITPSMPVAYIMFAVEALNTIQIQGSEVEAFMQAKGVLEAEINRCAEKKMKTNDITKFSISISIAQNTIDLLQRAKLTGMQAPLYKGFIDAIVEAAKAVNK